MEIKGEITAYRASILADKLGITIEEARKLKAQAKGAGAAFAAGVAAADAPATVTEKDGDNGE